MYVPPRSVAAAVVALVAVALRARRVHRPLDIGFLAAVGFGHARLMRWILERTPTIARARTREQIPVRGSRREERVAPLLGMNH